MFQPGQQVTVIDGGWTGIIVRIDSELQAAYIQFPGRPDKLAYAFEALTLTPGLFDMLTRAELHELHGTLCHQYDRQHRIIMGLMDLDRAAPGGGDIAALLASPMWRVLDASHREVDEMAEEVFQELQRRDTEEAINA